MSDVRFMELLTIAVQNACRSRGAEYSEDYGMDICTKLIEDDRLDTFYQMPEAQAIALLTKIAGDYLVDLRRGSVREAAALHRIDTDEADSIEEPNPLVDGCLDDDAAEYIVSHAHNKDVDLFIERLTSFEHGTLLEIAEEIYAGNGLTRIAIKKRASRIGIEIREKYKEFQETMSLSRS